MRKSKKIKIELKNAEHIKRIVRKLMDYTEQIGNGFDGYIRSKYPTPYYIQVHRMTLWKGFYDYLKLEVEKLYGFKYEYELLNELDESLKIVLQSVSNPDQIDDSTMFHVKNVHEICNELNSTDLYEEFPEDIKKYM